MKLQPARTDADRRTAKNVLRRMSGAAPSGEGWRDSGIVNHVYYGSITVMVNETITVGTRVACVPRISTPPQGRAGAAILSQALSRAIRADLRA
ncbi:hypothetical protein CHELA40_13364 [Chelatococcus asaccharovorans]|nr:hypothetical protein CHELA40_13364 [Chelatococcus asaccharovorans]CAH1678522.1 hypothetical protein CHELA17_62254 [Chelatococcus asaccharovorans]